MVEMRKRGVHPVDQRILGRGARIQCVRNGARGFPNQPCGAAVVTDQPAPPSSRYHPAVVVTAHRN
jgi:hypothetical protein